MRPRLAPTLMIIALTIGGCGRAPVATAPTAPPPPAQAEITALTEHAGQLLVEVPIGAQHGLAVGDFLRAYGAEADRRALKGTLQITELIGADRCVARLIALNDRTNPLRVGDRAKAVPDLSVEDPVAAAAPVATAPAAGDEARFAGVREHYQRELAAAERRHQAEVAELASQIDRGRADADERLARALADSELTHRTEVAALKADLQNRSLAQIAAENAARDQRLDEIAGERDALRAQVETLLREQDRLRGEVAVARADATGADERRRKELRAEVETREVLQARLAELEAKIDGKPSRTSVILTNDPERHETVLERLARLQDELAAANERQGATDGELAGARERCAALEASVAGLSGQVAEAERLRDDLDSARERVAQLASESAAHELGRVEAERALYDLAARVLRLDPGVAETAALQGRVRAGMSVGEGVAGSATTDEETP